MRQLDELLTFGWDFYHRDKRGLKSEGHRRGYKIVNSKQPFHIKISAGSMVK
jgi:hypothetical protein